IGTLTAGAFRQFHVTFQAGNPTDSFLLLVEATLSDSANNAARASDTRVVDAAPAFDYTITSPPSGQRVKPGDVIEFDVTVHNRSNSDRSLTLTGIVPLFTDNGGFGPGNAFGVVFGTVLAGTSQTRIASLTVRNGTVAPPNGATITLNLIDLVRAASISRSVVVGSVSTAKADFNGDGLPDWVLYNPLTHQLAVWYLNDGTFLGGAVLPTGWAVAGAADFNSDGKPDLLLWTPAGRNTAIWYLNGTAFLSGAGAPTLPAGGWRPAAIDDVNRDGKPDFVLWNPNTRQTA